MIENGVERESCLVHIRDDVEYVSPDHIFMKGMLMEKAGTIVGQHAHQYGHTSLLASGRVRVFTGDNDVDGVEYFAPAFIFVDAKIKHRFLSLEDNTHVYCIHNMSEYHLLNNDRPLVHEEHKLKEAS